MYPLRSSSSRLLGPWISLLFVGGCQPYPGPGGLKISSPETHAAEAAGPASELSYLESIGREEFPKSFTQLLAAERETEPSRAEPAFRTAIVSFVEELRATKEIQKPGRLEAYEHLVTRAEFGLGHTLRAQGSPLDAVLSLETNPGRVFDAAQCAEIKRAECEDHVQFLKQTAPGLISASRKVASLEPWLQYETTFTAEASTTVQADGFVNNVKTKLKSGPVLVRAGITSQKARPDGRIELRVGGESGSQMKNECNQIGTAEVVASRDSYGRTQSSIVLHDGKTQGIDRNEIALKRCHKQHESWVGVTVIADTDAAGAKMVEAQQGERRQDDGARQGYVWLMVPDVRAIKRPAQRLLHLGSVRVLTPTSCKR